MYMVTYSYKLILHTLTYLSLTQTQQRRQDSCHYPGLIDEETEA